MRRNMKGFCIPLSFSSDGRSMLASFDKDQYQLIDLPSGEQRRAFSNKVTKWGPERHILGCAALSPDGRLVAFIGDDDLVQVLDTSTGKNLYDFRSPGGYVLPLPSRRTAGRWQAVAKMARSCSGVFPPTANNASDAKCAQSPRSARPLPRHNLRT
jgi:WD40 repeat protein